MLNGVYLDSLTLDESLKLELPFSKEEAREVIWNVDGDKSPGPDGFNIRFFNVC